MLEFYLDRHAGIPTYLQLVQQVTHALRVGALHPGDRLPTVKEASAQLAINPNTVLKAYRELERGGLVEAHPGRGTFVRSGVAVAAVPDHPVLRDQLAAWVDRARAAGLTADDVLALVSTAVRRGYPERTEPAA
ncbi:MULTISPECIES: GntR family transcriptional regulator [unclassified Plantactinospora]|uniref:GntR family transcriptional regulator n=1 Tax=unclassified Plantactinospora TaxID=2631981 RepID=UPI000D15CA33|nr:MULTISPECIES: GntR family transcriptional regulator [unclassified Plantactinospora]AVT34090.1 GntR family transcriptional regulator [Plantactinospora sp. BC1]AVT41630.1 GntR family transcriptional regulator [Plantactinospora sp. BB1]